MYVCMCIYTEIHVDSRSLENLPSSNHLQRLRYSVDNVCVYVYV